MLRRILISSVTFTLFAFGVVAQDDKKGDKDKLQGEWTVVSLESPRFKLDEKGAKNSKLLVKSDEFLVTIDGRENKMTFQLDETKTPKEIDFSGTLKGIYKLEGETLTVCYPTMLGADRPKELKAGDGVALAVYKRIEKK